MKSKKEINSAVKDFLEGRMTVSEQKRFVKNIRSLGDENEQSAVFENIYEQISRLSRKEQKRLLKLLKGANTYQRTGLVRSLTRILPYAAIFLTVISIGFFLNKSIIHPTDAPITFHSDDVPSLKILDDGSEVYVEKGSALEVIEYSQETRVVHLRGKAKFSIKPSEAPFFVKTEEGLYTKVLGTRFSVAAYENNFEVSVEKGRVWVGNKVAPISVLTKGESISVKNGVIKRSSPFEKNQLTFNNIPLQEVLETLEKKFDTPIHLGDSVERNIRTKAQFPDDLTLIEIVDILCEIHGYKRIIDGDKINIIAD